MKLAAISGVWALVLGTPILAQSAEPDDRGAPPEAIKPADWVRERDLRSSRDRGAVRFVLAIDAGGHPYRCDIMHSSGVVALDGHTCDLMMKRATFRPAKDPAGMAVPSEWSRVVSWGQDIQADPLALYDAVITLNKLPSGKPAAALVVRETIAADGTREHCSVQPSGDDPALERKACSLIAQAGAASPLKTPDGTPARGIRALRVAFVAKAR